MHRPILMCAFVVFACGAMAQQQSQSDPYQGQSNPPADDAIVATQPEQAKPKPAAGKPMVQPQAQQQEQPAPPPATQQTYGAPQVAAQSAGQDPSAAPSANDPNAATAGTDEGIVRVGRPQEYTTVTATSSGLVPRGAADDPDGDIVRLHPDHPGVLATGTTIRVRLLDRLSSTESRQGEEFRTTVASDVLQDGLVLIPAGAEIDGHVVQVAKGTVRSGGTILLRPETVILSDGSRYRID